MAYSFTPTVDFFSDETRSQYVTGLNYTVRDGNDKLHSLVQEWIAAGKVVVGTAAQSYADGTVVASPGQITGAGKVS